MSSQARKVLGIVLGLTGGLFVSQAGLMYFSRRMARTATLQYGCSLSVPRPAIRDGQSDFTLSTRCLASQTKRQLDVELVGDDPSYDDALRWTSKTIQLTGGTFAVKGTNWRCHEDSTGSDEVYLRVRIESRRDATLQKASWVNGESTSANCH